MEEPTKKIKNLREVILEVVNGVIELRLSDEQLELLDYIYELAESENLPEIMDAIEDYRIRLKRCVVCGADDLETTFYEEDRGEYFGFPCHEKMCMKKCSNCGWKDE